MKTAGAKKTRDMREMERDERDGERCIPARPKEAACANSTQPGHGGRECDGVRMRSAPVGSETAAHADEEKVVQLVHLEEEADDVG